LAGLLAVSALAADVPLDDILKGVETRYNQAKSLQVLFRLEYTPAGRPGRVESGILMLRKPLRMRWDYSQPKGKLFIGDGKNLWVYTPADNTAEKMSMKESEDMRTPLAFLLGKLHFRKEFRNLKAVSEAAGTRITAEPKGDNLPYSQVEFVVNGDHQIRQVKVTGFDHSIMDFTFDQERLNPPLDAKLFAFQPPPGAQVVEGGQ
jgi:outer membrane lipoprotein carrier protein